MQFVDGLCYGIKTMLMIQHTSTLDSACVLALVQEEVFDSGKKMNYMRYEPSSDRTIHRYGFPFPSPPKPDKPLGIPFAEDRISTEATRANSVDDKLRTLK
jgi:hypothetical protein